MFPVLQRKRPAPNFGDWHGCGGSNAATSGEDGACFGTQNPVRPLRRSTDSNFDLGYCFTPTAILQPSPNAEMALAPLHNLCINL